MNDEDFLKLRRLVVSYHHALERHDFSDDGGNLKNFPVEFCHHACQWLVLKRQMTVYFPHEYYQLS